MLNFEHILGILESVQACFLLIIEYCNCIYSIIELYTVLITENFELKLQAENTLCIICRIIEAYDFLSIDCLIFKFEGRYIIGYIKYELVSVCIVNNSVTQWGLQNKGLRPYVD